MGHAAAAAARRLRRGDRLRRLDARRPGRPPPVAPRRERVHPRAARPAGAAARRLPRHPADRQGRRRGGLPARRRPGDRLGPGRADGRRPRTTPSSAACPRASTRSAGTTTRTTCRPRAEELARSARCNQAYRLGEAAWGIQFHAEVTLETVRSWLDDKDEFPLDLDRERCGRETQERIGAWNDLGDGLCGAFVEAAERAAVAVRLKAPQGRRDLAARASRPPGRGRPQLVGPDDPEVRRRGRPGSPPPTRASRRPSRAACPSPSRRRARRPSARRASRSPRSARRTGPRSATRTGSRASIRTTWAAGSKSGSRGAAGSPIVARPMRSARNVRSSPLARSCAGTYQRPRRATRPSGSIARVLGVPSLRA